MRTLLDILETVRLDFSRATEAFGLNSYTESERKTHHGLKRYLSRAQTFCMVLQSSRLSWPNALMQFTGFQRACLDFEALLNWERIQSNPTTQDLAKYVGSVTFEIHEAQRSMDLGLLVWLI